MKEHLPSNKKNYALAYAKKGYRVFPVVPNGKTPTISDWPK
ncbi:MAG: bifunctional DNA primase/polymerase [Gammaproteobacteria bacterium]